MSNETVELINSSKLFLGLKHPSGIAWLCWSTTLPCLSIKCFFFAWPAIFKPQTNHIFPGMAVFLYGWIQICINKPWQRPWNRENTQQVNYVTMFIILLGPGPIYTYILSFSPNLILCAVVCSLDESPKRYEDDLYTVFASTSKFQDTLQIFCYGLGCEIPPRMPVTNEG